MSQDTRVVGEHYMSGRDLFDRSPEVDVHAAFFQHLGGISLGLGREGGQDGVPHVNHMNSGLINREVRVLLL
jgi:hypothetical protein